MYLLLLFQQQCFSLEPHFSHKIKTAIIMSCIQNQNSLLVKWQTDSIIPGGGGRVDREVRRLVPSSDERSESRCTQNHLHPDSLREKTIKIAFVIAEGI